MATFGESSLVVHQQGPRQHLVAGPTSAGSTSSHPRHHAPTHRQLDPTSAASRESNDEPYRQPPFFYGYIDSRQPFPELMAQFDFMIPDIPTAAGRAPSSRIRRCSS